MLSIPTAPLRLAALALAIAFAFALFPQSPRDQAAALYRQKRFPEAAQALVQHLAANPGDFPSRLLLGLCYQQAGDKYKAEAVFQDAVRRRPRSAEARFDLARIEYLLSRFTEAEAAARLALQLGASPARTEDLLGLILAERNSNDEALAAYDAALRADPRFAEAYFDSGVLLLKLNRPADAAARLSQSLRLNPRSAEALYHRARAYLALGNTAAAEKDLAASFSLDHNAAAGRLLAELRSSPAPAAKPASIAPHSVAPIRFRDVADSAGLHFTLHNHPTPQKYLVETMPGGVAAFDYNNDGLIDIYFTNGASVPSLEKDSPQYSNRLFRNDGHLKFTDVTSEAGVAGAGYSIGAAAADYDNDGFADLFVAGVNRNILYHNTGRGRFEDVTAKAGIHSGVWSVAAGWFDYDNDGLLDLFVVNYLRWSPSLDRFCGDPIKGLRVYCHPHYFEGLANTLYHNRGDGAFEDVSQKSGIAGSIGKGMSVSFADYDGDGLTDIFVTNDTLPNFLFHNRGDGTFEEVALPAGVALPDDGKPVSAMGSDFRDADNDGLPDIAFTALSGETFPLFHNVGKGFFRDVTYPSRLALLSAPRSGWSMGLFDFNNDGWKDLFSANSHVMDNIDQLGPQRYRQPNSVFANRGDGTFEDMSAASFQSLRAHRGAAFADFNNDGKIDIVVSALGEPAELWENTSPEPNHWLRLELEGVKSNRDAIGAVVRLLGQSNHMTTSVGYASSSRQGVHFGIGKTQLIDKIEILWPSGIKQTLTNVKPDQVLKVREPSR
ncbi:MAG TPA: FG-GAP-like repeat-containing protein [Bryobacterales bacterium]|nr:FG-GAP-like repeat-containing protein [Bryobacterales bacterium]